MPVDVKLTNGTTTKTFRAVTAKALLKEVQKAFGNGTVEDSKGITLTAEYGNLELGEYTWTASAEPSVPPAVQHPQDKFRSLLVAAGYSDAYLDENKRALQRAAELYPTLLIVMRTEEEATKLFEKVSAMPHTSTCNSLRAQDLQINGPYQTDVGSRSLILHAFCQGIPKILKVPLYKEDAVHEYTVWSRLCVNGESPPHLAGPLELISFCSGSDVTFRAGRREAEVGLLLPIFVCTLSHNAMLSEKQALGIGRKLKVALTHMHKCGLAHCDVKPSNIFYDATGDCFLGDFGGTVEIGFAAKEVSDTYLKKGTDQQTLIASETLDWWALAVTLVEKMRKLQGVLPVGLPEMRNAMTQITDPECRDFVTALLE